MPLEMGQTIGRYRIEEQIAAERHGRRLPRLRSRTGAGPRRQGAALRAPSMTTWRASAFVTRPASSRAWTIPASQTVRELRHDQTASDLAGQRTHPGCLCSMIESAQERARRREVVAPGCRRWRRRSRSSHAAGVQHRRSEARQSAAHAGRCLEGPRLRVGERSPTKRCSPSARR